MKRRKPNPRLVYKKGPGKLVRDYATGKEVLKKPKGPGIKFGKINWPSREQRDEYMTRFVAAASRIGEIRDPEKMKAEYKKVQKLQEAFEKSLDKKRARLEKEIDRMKEKGYEYDSTLSEAEAKKAVRQEQAAIKAGEAELKRVKAEVDKILSKIDGKNVAKKKKKKVSKKARKKVSKKKASKRKATKKKAKGYKRKRNPIKSLDSMGGIEIMDNPRRKKSRRKASKKKASKKKAAKKVSKKKATKKVSKKKKSTKRKGSKRKGSKKKGSRKAMNLIDALIGGKSTKKRKSKKSSKRRKSKIKAIAHHPSAKKSKSKSRKKKNYKLKGNPNKEKFMVKFEQVTQHTVAEAAGLLGGGALIKIYDHHLKQRFLTPALSPLLSKLGAGAPVVDSLIDVLAAALLGAGISRIPVKGADVLGKGLIGASVVQLGIKSIASLSTAVGMPMSGIIAVPSMNGIIAVPQGMNGIIGVPQMSGFSADFQGMGAAGMTNADFGAYTTVGLNGGLGQSYMQDADYGSGSVIPTAPRQPESLGAYADVEYSDEGEDGDF